MVGSGKGTALDSVGQWDTHRNVVTGQHYGPADGRVRHGQTKGQRGTVWDSGTLIVMWSQVSTMGLLMVGSGMARRRDSVGQWDTHRDVVTGQHYGLFDGRFRHGQTKGQLGTVGHSP